MHEVNLIQVRSMTAFDAAVFLDGHLRRLEEDYKSGFVARGMILIEVQERRLWEHLADETGQPYRSFEQWVCSAAPHSRRDCFYAMKAVKELASIPLEQLAEIPRCNLALLQSLSTAVRNDPEVVAAAQCMPEKEFRAKVIQDHPSQHIQQRHRLILTYSDSDWQSLIEGLDKVGELLGIEDREGQILGLVIDWVQERK